ncbi:YcjF family protein [Roseovarius pelagicus]|uniref:TIGR01620 family protein n=1 Tax=Roseovarius pelagicus TaxID=2980108 RepID=A0ABY6DIF1_9RHOB|nr:TIGR01620 family protein [Roseovarius pelagicus]UXX85038.1 TIGR01620 family protein [Roseovarius pelagicus]
MRKGPILFDIETEELGKPAINPAEAPPVPDHDPVGGPTPEGRAMQTVAALGARKTTRLGRFFWSLLLTLLGVVVSVAAWDFVTDLIARMPLLGYAVTVLIAVLVLVLAVIAVRELAAFSRLRRIDTLHRAADTALADDDLAGARKVVEGLTQLYAAREDTAWGRQRLQERQADQFDPATLLALAEAELLAPLDAAAKKEVEAAARQVATVTAIVPLALADVFAALTSNLRMIRRVAEVYGGRSGTLGSWRLARAVMAHLVATGAVAVGDDLIGSVAGGSLLSKLSRRFGEGIVNGALTARVGVAAMEVCRPLPFSAGKRPSVSRLVSRALAGLFPGSGN